MKNKGEVPVNLNDLVEDIRCLGKTYQGDPIAVLGLLRVLESLHREIRDGMFQECLPENRQQLYALLRDIEAQGGWPYIPRMRVQALLQHLGLEVTTQESPQINNAPPQE